jgi:hypothetical protein
MSYFYLNKQTHTLMKTTKRIPLTPEEKKARKAAAAKALREKRKAEKAKQFKWENLQKFEHAFDHKIRLYKNLKLEKTNSYCASAGSPLKFEVIKNENNITVFPGSAHRSPHLLHHPFRIGPSSRGVTDS